MTNSITNIIALSKAIELIDQCECSIFDAETEIPMWDEIKAKLTNIKASYEKRATAERKPSKAELAKKAENAQFAEQVLGAIATEAQTAKALADTFGVTPQKITSALVALRKDGKVVDVPQEKKSYPHLWKVVDAE